MSNLLDLSLQEIISENKSERSERRRSARTRNAPKGPAAGVHKHRKDPKSNRGGNQTSRPKPKSSKGSKVLVEHLPKDVTEKEIKEYFEKTVGKVKHIDISYNSNGTSRGQATVVFVAENSGAKAASELDGILIDGKAIRVEMILDQVASETLAEKTLGDRVSAPVKPKQKQRESAKPKSAVPTEKDKKKGGERKGKGRTARPAKKTAEELDSEMADYFNNAEGAGNAQAAIAPAEAGAAAAPGDATMEDEIS